MFTRHHALRGLAVGGLAAAALLSLAPMATSRAATGSPADAAVSTLASDSAAAAAESLPADFSARFGYQPAVEDGLLGAPTGGCSSPVPLPEEFEVACRQHDLGYDLLRYAGRSGHALDEDARRAVDDRLAIELDDSCDVRDEALGRTTCRAWADVASGFVRLNSVRQGYGPPDPETPLTMAPAVALAVAAVGGAGLVLRSRRSWLSRAWLSRAWLFSRLRLPRASTALVTPVAVGAAVFPSYLPHLPVALGVMAGLFLLIGQAVTRRLAGPTPHLTGAARAVAVALGGALTAYLLVLTLGTQDAMRARIGMDPVSPTDIAVTIGTAVTLVGIVRGVAWLWHQRARVSRRALASIAAAGLVVAAPASARAAEVTGDDVLRTPSPVGAVRVYAGLSDSADPSRRARVAVDRLVASGGLQREHVVVMIPTGSGWVNPEFVRGVEGRFGSEVASVAMQYDHRPSWLAFLLDRDRAVDGGEAMLDAVTRAVATQPASERPQVHVVGESLGATAGQAAMIEASPEGAARRAAVCSTFWLGTPGGHSTGLPRETLAANADDPIVHASPAMVWRPTGEGRAWLPMVSGVHAGADVLNSLAMPFGSGHRYGVDQAARLQTC